MSHLASPMASSLSSSVECLGSWLTCAGPMGILGLEGNDKVSVLGEPLTGGGGRGRGRPILRVHLALLDKTGL